MNAVSFLCQSLVLFIGLNASFETTSLTEQYYLVFCAEEGMPGHAFVLFGKETAEEQMSIMEAGYGLYPIEGGKDVVLGAVPGEFRDDRWRNYQHSLVIKVNEKEYAQALKIKEYWENQPNSYALTKTDCLSFLIEVASFAGLELPARKGLANFPALFVKKLVALNP